MCSEIRVHLDKYNIIPVNLPWMSIWSHMRSCPVEGNGRHYRGSGQRYDNRTSAVRFQKTLLFY